MFNAANILEALKNYIRTRGGTSNAYNIAEAVNDLNSIPQGSGGDIPPEVENAIETHGMGWTESSESEGFDITWDGDTTGLDVVAIDNMSFYKISDNLTGIRKASDLIGSSVVVELDPPETFVLSENDVTTDDGKVYTVGEGGMLVVAFEDGVIGIGVEFSKGIWFPSLEENEGRSYVSRLYKEASTEEVVHQIDQKYIPQSSGGSNLFVLHINASMDENEELVFTSDETYQDCLDAITSRKVACAVLHILNGEVESTQIYSYIGPAFYAGATEEGTLEFATVFSYDMHEGEFSGMAWRIWFTPQNTLENFYSTGLG